MERIAQHKVLLGGEDFAHCSSQVKKFFDLSSLVVYDCVETVEEHSCSANQERFFEILSQAEGRNRQIAAELLGELVKAGIRQPTDLLTIEQGYQSKTLHILSHFLDGFIGTDSYFYNLVDDSHWLPSATAARIRQQPERYWLIHLDCFSATPGEAGLLHL
jgi:hypothetical protein